MQLPFAIIEMQSFFSKVFKLIDNMNEKNKLSVSDLKEALDELKIDLIKNSYSKKDTNYIVYALAVTADEILTKKNILENKTDMLENQLFNSNNANTRFFTDLTACKTLHNHGDSEILEIFYFCLSIGFTGNKDSEVKRHKEELWPLIKNRISSNSKNGYKYLTRGLNKKTEKLRKLPINYFTYSLILFYMGIVFSIFWLATYFFWDNHVGYINDLANELETILIYGG